MVPNKFRLVVSDGTDTTTVYCYECAVDISPERVKDRLRLRKAQEEGIVLH